MPAYDFKCPVCGHIEEIVCSMGEITEKTVLCPKCEEDEAPNAKVTMKRVFSTGNFVLKGDGWPSKKFRRQHEDMDIKRQRRKACVLKNEGDVPQDSVLGLKESDKIYDNKYTEGQLDDLYSKSIEEG